MRIDTLGIEAFVAISDLGSFRRGATHLNVSQTAVSHRIRKLEDSLGVKLFTRSTRQVHLTEAGAELLPKARALLQDFARQLDDVRERHRDRAEVLTFACMPTLAVSLLPAVFGAFMAQRPRTRVRLFDRSAAEIGHMVAAGQIEFGITVLAGHKQKLAATPLFRDDYVCLLPEAHPLAARRALAWDDIAAQPLVRFTVGTANRTVIDEALGPRAEAFRWTYEVQHTMTAMTLVQGGLAAAIMPRLSSLDRPSGLVAVPLAGPVVTRAVGVIRRPNEAPSDLARSFETLLRAQVAQTLGRGPTARAAAKPRIRRA